MATLNEPAIPQNITVHLGAPTSKAENITIPFTDYIKNVASHEIYPTWPENAIRANIYAIISYALNRIYTEWYPSRGYDFDITNTTRFDQAYVKDGEVYENISLIVDEIFNNYVSKQGNVEPLFTQFCNGTTSTCNGLSQWGTVSLANEGLSPLDILKRYYGNDISIVENAPVEDIVQSYPGVPLRLGDSGNAVKILQTELNRIARNYPAIPKITDPESVFGVGTENAVKEFQRIFNLTPNGTVDKSTWYKIKQYYVGVKKLSELISEGVSLEEAQLPFTRQLSEGMSGIGVQTLQYYLNVLAYFNPQLSYAGSDGNFTSKTTQSVKDFQSFYGLPVTGVVNAQTWNTVNKIYIESLEALPEGYTNGRAKLYPGFFLTKGMRNNAVTDLQTYLSLIGKTYPEIPEIPVTGYFGEQTENAVKTFQSLFGLISNGAVGPVTWYAIAREYDSILFPDG